MIRAIAVPISIVAALASAQDRIPVLRDQKYYVWVPLGDGLSIIGGRLSCTAKPTPISQGALAMVAATTRWAGIPAGATIIAVHRNGILQRIGLDYSVNAANEIIPDPAYPAWAVEDIVHAHWTPSPASTTTAVIPLRSTRVVRLAKEQ